MQFTNLTRQIEIGANCYWLQAAGKNIVLDCGMHPQHEGVDALPNLELLPDDSVDAIVITHAHHDHIGALPLLMRRQPRARVFLTAATHRLTDVMLHNSVNVMTKQREELGIASYPLFTHGEVELLMRRWQICPLHQRWSISGERLPENDESEMSFEFFDSGHVLGSVGVLIRADGKSVLYTGDVNFEDQSIMRAARFPAQNIDVLITETTRGDRATPEGFTREGEMLRFAEALEGALERGLVLIPVFALGKTQEFLAIFCELRKRGLLAMVPIYIGGLSTKLTQIYDSLADTTPRQKPDLRLLEDVAPFVLSGRDAGANIMKPNRIYALSSGMMTEKTLSNVFGQRVLGDPSASIFFVGYAAPNSPAGKVRAAQPGGAITIDPAFPPQGLKCRVEQFNFSAHSSRESIRAYVGKLLPQKIVLVHGDPAAIGWFQNTLAADLPQSQVIVPTPGEALELWRS